jgi:hypothetical protein
MERPPMVGCEQLAFLRVSREEDEREGKRGIEERLSDKATDSIDRDT